MKKKTTVTKPIIYNDILTDCEEYLILPNGVIIEHAPRLSEQLLTKVEAVAPSIIEENHVEKKPNKLAAYHTFLKEEKERIQKQFPKLSKKEITDMAREHYKVYKQQST